MVWRCGRLRVWCGLRIHDRRPNFATVAVGGGERLRIVAGRLGQPDDGAGYCDDLAG